MSVFTGAGVAIITPMKENGEVNYEKLGEFLDYQINNSTDAIVICGTTGEASTLTHEEHVEAIRFTADYVKKRVPVIAGTGSNCTETAIYLSKEAQKAGVDGCLVVTPYYNKATQKGLIQHYTAVAKSVDLPIIMYNVPRGPGKWTQVLGRIARLFSKYEDVGFNIHFITVLDSIDEYAQILLSARKELEEEILSADTIPLKEEKSFNQLILKKIRQHILWKAGKRKKNPKIS